MRRDVQVQVQVQVLCVVVNVHVHVLTPSPPPCSPQVCVQHMSDLVLQDEQQPEDSRTR